MVLDVVGARSQTAVPLCNVSHEQVLNQALGVPVGGKQKSYISKGAMMGFK